MADNIRIDRVSGRDVKTLVEFARQTVKYQSGGLAAHVRLGQYKHDVPTENFLFAINMFRQMVDQQQGRLFVLDNSDLVFVYKGVRPHHVRSAIEKVRLLYSDVLLHAEKNHGGVEFCTWFSLNTEAPQFLRFAEGLLETSAPVTGSGTPEQQASPAPASADQFAPEELPVETPSAELIRLAHAVEGLAKLELGGLVRRQAVCVLRDGYAPEPVFQELYVSIADLERRLMPVGRLAGERWLFQYFTRLLDHRMLDFLTGSRQPDFSGYFSLNLNVSSVLSPEFAAFARGGTDSTRNTIVLEFQKVDVFSDLGTFYYVRDMIRDYGYRVCLDGLTDLSLPFVDRQRLGLDMIKMRWRPDILKDARPAHSTEFVELVRQTDPTRIILCRADSQGAIEFGRTLGINMFQGQLVDQLLEMPAVA